MFRVASSLGPEKHCVVLCVVLSYPRHDVGEYYGKTCEII